MFDGPQIRLLKKDDHFTGTELEKNGWSSLKSLVKSIREKKREKIFTEMVQRNIEELQSPRMQHEHQVAFSAEPSS